MSTKARTAEVIIREALDDLIDHKRRLAVVEAEVDRTKTFIDTLRELVGQPAKAPVLDVPPIAQIRGHIGGRPDTGLSRITERVQEVIDCIRAKGPAAVSRQVIESETGRGGQSISRSLNTALQNGLVQQDDNGHFAVSEEA